MVDEMINSAKLGVTAKNYEKLKKSTRRVALALLTIMGGSL